MVSWMAITYLPNSYLPDWLQSDGSLNCFCAGIEWGLELDFRTGFMNLSRPAAPSIGYLSCCLVPLVTTTTTILVRLMLRNTNAILRGFDIKFFFILHMFSNWCCRGIGTIYTSNCSYASRTTDIFNKVSRIVTFVGPFRGRLRMAYLNANNRYQRVVTTCRLNLLSFVQQVLVHR